MIRHQISIDAPAALVFRMLTEPDGLRQWMAVAATSDPCPGGTLRWTYANGDVVEGTYEVVEPPRRLVFTYGWSEPASRGVPPGSTRVEITLTEHQGTTELTLEHHGLSPDLAPDHAGGWQHFLGRLQTRLEDA
ncbi:MAG: SRPBCC domain-containing protein [Myxococcales bacterium]|nr:SRPBCC domain-containing protein [Myxococcales bacterium]